MTYIYTLIILIFIGCGHQNILIIKSVFFTALPATQYLAERPSHYILVYW